MTAVHITTIWRTATAQCEVVVHGVSTLRVRLWIRGRLVVDELAVDADTAIQRGQDLRAEWGDQLDSS
jgi:hypothetical protein